MKKIPIDVLLDAWYLKHEDKTYDCPPGGDGMSDLERRVFDHIADLTEPSKKGVRYKITRFYPAHLLQAEYDSEYIYNITVQLRGDDGSH